MKLKVSEILKLLCRHISTIYQEINQGTAKFRKSNLSVRKEYSAYYSLNIRQGLMSKTGRKLQYIELCPKLLSYIQSKLDEKYSPNAISGELNKEDMYTVCSQTIYNYISLGILNSRTYRKCTSKEKTNGIYIVARYFVVE